MPVRIRRKDCVEPVPDNVEELPGAIVGVHGIDSENSVIGFHRVGSENVVHGLDVHGDLADAGAPGHTLEQNEVVENGSLFDGTRCSDKTDGVSVLNDGIVLEKQCVDGIVDAPVDNRAYDSTAELRAMILAALPYPPLPVMLTRLEDGNVLGSEVLQTSHDVLSNLLLHACARCTIKENKERQARQQNVLRSFIHSISKDGLQSMPDLYKTYCWHTQKHIETYLSQDSNVPNMRFMPFDSVCKGDYVHTRACDFMAAQARLLETGYGLCAQDWQGREYPEMILMTRQRLIDSCDGEDES